MQNPYRNPAFSRPPRKASRHAAVPFPLWNVNMAHSPRDDEDAMYAAIDARIREHQADKGQALIRLMRSFHADYDDAEMAETLASVMKALEEDRLAEGRTLYS